MKSPGTMLREAREERGLTLDDVAAMTRVPKPMLKHLERDRFEEYEADVFARGHLRSYAQELRLDVDEVIQAYERKTGRQKSREHADKPADAGDDEVDSVTAGGASDSTDELRVGSGGMAAVIDAFSGIRRTHVIAVVLGLVGLFVVFAYLGNSSVTAQDTAEYDEGEMSDWELEQDVEETRWLLEQSETDSEE